MPTVDHAPTVLPPGTLAVAAVEEPGHPLPHLADDGGDVNREEPLQRRPWWATPASTSTLPSGPPSAKAATTSPPASAAPKWKTVDEATSALVKAVAEADKATLDAAKLYIFTRLNGMKPEASVAELATVQRLDALYRVVPTEKTVDVPRLSTAIAGVMSKKPADTIAALMSQMGSSRSPFRTPCHRRDPH